MLFRADQLISNSCEQLWTLEAEVVRRRGDGCRPNSNRPRVRRQPLPRPLLKFNSLTADAADPKSNSRASSKLPQSCFVRRCGGRFGFRKWARKAFAPSGAFIVYFEPLILQFYCIYPSTLHAQGLADSACVSVRSHRSKRAPLLLPGWVYQVT